jgi:hypothetical protein
VKKAILIALLFMLVLPSLVWAGDIDGIWWDPALGLSGLVMVRENGGTVIASEMNLLQFGEPYDYCVLIGSQNGNTISFQNTAYCGVQINLTMTLTSATAASVYVNRCTPIYSCIFPSGVSFNVVKGF